MDNCLGRPPNEPHPPVRIWFPEYSNSSSIAWAHRNAVYWWRLHIYKPSRREAVYFFWLYLTFTIMRDVIVLWVSGLTVYLMIYSFLTWSETNIIFSYTHSYDESRTWSSFHSICRFLETTRHLVSRSKCKLHQALTYRKDQSNFNFITTSQVKSN